VTVAAAPAGSISTDLKQVLKRLKLGGLLPILPDRLALAKQRQMDYGSFLELVLSDEISRREQGNLERRLRAAGFEEVVTLEQWDDSANVQYDRQLLQELFGLHFLERHEHVLLVGPVGVGKSFLASALGHAACRAGYSVLFVRADTMLKTLAAARADYTFDRELRRFVAAGRSGDRRLRPAQTHRSAVLGHVRRHHRSPPPFQLDHHLQPRRGGVGGAV
jgi:DNA replication protein DnaC